MKCPKCKRKGISIPVRKRERFCRWCGHRWWPEDDVPYEKERETTQDQ